MEKKAKAEAKRTRRIKRKQAGDVSNLQETPESPDEFDPNTTDEFEPKTTNESNLTASNGSGET